MIMKMNDDEWDHFDLFGPWNHPEKAPKIAKQKKRLRIDDQHSSGQAQAVAGLVHSPKFIKAHIRKQNSCDDVGNSVQKQSR